ncbi:MAG: spermidine/putrescine transport system substrate-binding protein [Halioglobus sp.]|jgi:spermidine/putrescine transport system substrate-binding protein
MATVASHSVFRCSLFKLMLLLCLPVSYAQAEALVVYTWKDYFTTNFVKLFEQETGHTLDLKYFDSDLERDTKLSDDKVDFDLVITDAYTLGAYSETGLLHQLSPEQFSNFKNLDVRWQDTCGDLGVPLFWGGVGISYRTSQVSAPVDSWNQLMFPEAALSGRVSMLYDTYDVLIPALKLLDYSANTSDVRELKQAYKLLQDQQPHVLDYVSAYRVLVTSSRGKDLAMAQSYSGDQLRLVEHTGHEDWNFVFPKEGTVTWADCMSIKMSSNSAPAVIELINFILDPQISASLSQEIRIATPNKSALELADPGYRDDPAIFMTEAILQRTVGQLGRAADIQAIRNKILLSLKKQK